MVSDIFSLTRNFIKVKSNNALPMRKGFFFFFGSQKIADNISVDSFVRVLV